MALKQVKQSPYDNNETSVYTTLPTFFFLSQEYVHIDCEVSTYVSLLILCKLLQSQTYKVTRSKKKNKTIK